MTFGLDLAFLGAVDGVETVRLWSNDHAWLNVAKAVGTVGFFALKIVIENSNDGMFLKSAIIRRMLGVWKGFNKQCRLSLPA